MFKVITMSDANYFGAGQLFLRTRKKVKADFVLYGPDLTDKQIYILGENDIEYIKIDDSLYKTEMQALKFFLVAQQISLDYDKKYNGFTLVDFDTFFVNDWGHIFDYDFDYGITIRNDMVNKRCLRAYTNGGVVFAKHSACKLLDFARKIILNGKDDRLPEYDRIWKTLETGRPAHKTHYRTALRWWVDQVFLSAMALRYFETHGYHKIGLDPVFFDFDGTRIGLFGCSNYNVLESEPVITNEKDIYIRHLKSTGRKTLGVNKTIEKLEKN